MNEREKQLEKYDRLKSKLKSEIPKRSISDFWYDSIKPACGISYFHFSNIMRGRYDQERKDVIEVVDRYLGEDNG